MILVFIFAHLCPSSLTRWQKNYSHFFTTIMTNWLSHKKSKDQTITLRSFSLVVQIEQFTIFGFLSIVIIAWQNTRYCRLHFCQIGLKFFKPAASFLRELEQSLFTSFYQKAGRHSQDLPGRSYKLTSVRSSVCMYVCYQLFSGLAH